MFRRFVHGSGAHGAGGESSVPGSFRGRDGSCRGRDGSFHRKKQCACTCRKSSMEAIGTSMCKTLIVFKHLPLALTRRARKLQQIKGKQYHGQSSMESVEPPAENCIDVHHQNEQAGGRSREMYTRHITCCQLRLLLFYYVLRFENLGKLRGSDVLSCTCLRTVSWSGIYFFHDVRRESYTRLR